MAIERVKIGAEIRIGTLVIRTPYILSFNVNRARGQISTFSASVKVSHTDISGTIAGDKIEIYAGESSGGAAGSRGSSKRIFSGIIRKATMTPCFNDPMYVILNLSGADILSLLQGKKFTRRCAGQKSAWVMIQSVSRQGLKSGKFKYKNDETMFFTDAEIKSDSNLHTTAPFKAFNKSTPAKASEPEPVPLVATLQSE